MHNATREKILALSPLDFLAEQVLLAGPGALPLWLAGLGFLALAPGARPFRPLFWCTAAVLSVLLGSTAKAYYLAPVYPMLFAAGGVAVETWSARRFPRAAPLALGGLVVTGGILALPLAKPVLPLETYVRYADWWGLRPATGERQAVGRLPQFYADMLGWRELARSVAQVYASLPAEDRAHAAIFGQNYGQAGAIDFFGPGLGLPKAISGHNSYYLWGPRGATGEIVIVIGDQRERLEELFESVELGASYSCADCMPYEARKSIWVCRFSKVPVDEMWPQV